MQLFTVVNILNRNKKVQFPDIHITSICKLTTNMLRDHDISYLIVDIDQTVTEYHGCVIDKQIYSKLLEIKQFLGKQNICFLTNHKDIKRNLAIEATVQIKVINTKYKKPGSLAFNDALNYFGVSSSKKIAMIGDRVWTDVIGANNFGLFSILVNPFSPSNEPFIIKALRKIELNQIKPQ